MTPDLSKLNKEELLHLLDTLQKRSFFFRIRDYDILNTKWEVTSAKAQRPRDESIKEREAAGYEYDLKTRKARLEADAKWERAEKLGEKADRFFEKMMAAMEGSRLNPDDQH
jgi:hypothetical protein